MPQKSTASGLKWSSCSIPRSTPWPSRGWFSRFGGVLESCQASRSISGLHAFDRAFLHPGHEGAKTGADFFDGMLFALFEQGVVVFVTGLIFADPAFGK